MGHCFSRSDCCGSRGYLAAREVQLRWTAPANNTTAIYVEAYIEKTTLGSYFVPISFAGGYVALQDSSRRRITFYVENVKNHEKDDACESSISTLDCPEHTSKKSCPGGMEFVNDELKWDTEKTLKFLLLHAGVNDGPTHYAAYANVGEGWQLLASVAVAKGKPFVDHMSYIHDHRRDGSSAQQERRANFGPIWFRSPEGKWVGAELATFTSMEVEDEDPEHIFTVSKIDQQKGITGSRVLATGGDLVSHKKKIGESYKVNAPRETMPSDLPDFPEWFETMAHPIH